MQLIPSRFSPASLAMFASQALENFQATAAIAPSSPFLAEAMVRKLPLRNAHLVIEFGPGTGVMTRALLEALPPEAELLAFEVNPRFIAYLRQQIRDPRLTVIEGGAETAAQELQRRSIPRVDAVLSSLGLSMLPAPMLENLFTGLLPFLDGDSVFTQFQYFHQVRIEDGRASFYNIEQELLKNYFGSIERSWVLRNLPPAFVYHCRK